MIPHETIRFVLATLNQAFIGAAEASPDRLSSVAPRTQLWEAYTVVAPAACMESAADSVVPGIVVAVPDIHVGSQHTIEAVASAATAVAHSV